MLTFDPRGKTYCFHLGDRDCYRKNSGICSLDGFTLKQIRDLDLSSSSTSRAYSREYCLGMAKMFLEGTFKAPAAVRHNTVCEHYDFSDGQHRTCVATRLLRLGADIDYFAEVTQHDAICRYCSLNEKYTNQLNSLSKLQLVLKTTKYREIVSAYEQFKSREFLLSL